MNRLSLADLKAQKGSVIANLEAIKGGNLAKCHNGVIVVRKGETTVNMGSVTPDDRIKIVIEY